MTPATAVGHYLSLVKPGLNVHTIHAELEGRGMAPSFVELLRRLRELKVRFVTLAEAAAEYAGQAPDCGMSMGEIPGRAGLVAIQEKK